MYQRFSFENQSPEKQRELLEKQARQQQQREMLQQQVEERRRQKEFENNREYQREPRNEQIRQPPTQNYAQPPQQQFQQQQQPPQQQNSINPVMIDFSRPSNYNNNGGKDNMQTQPLVFAAKNSLLQDRGQRNYTDNKMMSMSLTPNTIHDAFASLRHQIMTTAASTVISRSTSPNSTRRRQTQTFHEGESF